MDKVHTGVVFPCDKCEFQSSIENNLKRHILYKHTERTEEELRQFPCNQCDYATITKDRLKTHMKVHQEADLFMCDECNFTTRYLSSLKMHRGRKHAGKEMQRKKRKRRSFEMIGKDIKCDMCEYTSTVRKYVTEHRKKMHGVKN